MLLNLSFEFGNPYEILLVNQVLCLKKNTQLSEEALVSPAYYKEPVDALPVNYNFQKAVIHLCKHKWENTCLAKAIFRSVCTLSIFL